MLIRAHGPHTDSQHWADRRSIISRITVRPLIVMLVMALSAGLGLLIVRDPRIVVLPVIPVSLYWMMVNPTVRLSFITFGGVLTLQSAEGLSPLKLLYLSGCLVCVLVGALRLTHQGSDRAKKDLAFLMQWSWLWVGLIFVSLLVAVSHDIPIEDWLRGAVPYLLFACAPVVVYDVVRDAPSETTYRIIRWCFVGAGLLSAVSWFIAWTSRRGYAQLDVERLFLWSFALSLALFCYAISVAYHERRHRLRWFLLALVIVALFGLTGTRQTILFVLAPLMMIVLGQGRSIRRMFSFSLSFIPSLAIAIGGCLVFSQVIGLDLSQVQDRFSGLTELTNQGAEGRSYQERVVQTDLAREAFANNIWTGVSPGHRYEWLTSYAGTKDSFTIDSPLALPANFGLLGVLVTAITFWNLRRFIQTVTSKYGQSAATTEIDAVKTFSLILLVYFLAGSPFEDKGLAFSFMFLFSLTMVRLLNSECSSDSAKSEELKG